MTRGYALPTASGEACTRTQRAPQIRAECRECLRAVRTESYDRESYGHGRGCRACCQFRIIEAVGGTVRVFWSELLR